MDKRRILVADDETGVRAVLAKMLSKDYIILEAANGEEAVGIAKAQQPDLILMDLIMPKMDGYTACSEIKADEATKGIPVVVLTAVGHPLNKKFAIEMGAAGYVTKPFNIEELIYVINRLLVKAPQGHNTAVQTLKT
jgi:CheY-like chemotaxis protein